MEKMLFPVISSNNEKSRSLLAGDLSLAVEMTAGLVAGTGPKNRNDTTPLVIWSIPCHFER